MPAMAKVVHRAFQQALCRAKRPSLEQSEICAGSERPGVRRCRNCCRGRAEAGCRRSLCAPAARSKWWPGACVRPVSRASTATGNTLAAIAKPCSSATNGHARDAFIAPSRKTAITSWSITGCRATSRLAVMISLCAACHAIVERLQAVRRPVLSAWPLLVVVPTPGSRASSIVD